MISTSIHGSSSIGLTLSIDVSDASAHSAAVATDNDEHDFSFNADTTLAKENRASQIHSIA